MAAHTKQVGEFSAKSKGLKFLSCPLDVEPLNNDFRQVSITIGLSKVKFFVYIFT